MTDEQAKPIIVGSHRRSGTHLLIDTIRMNFADCRAKRALGVNPHYWAYLNIDRLNPENKVPITPDAADATLARAVRPLIKSHNYPDMREAREELREFAYWTSENATKLYVVRDPRTVVCSYWIYRRGFDSSTADNVHDFMRQEERDGMTRTQAWADHVRAWMETPGTLTLKFEDIVKDTSSVLDRIAEHAGMARDRRERLLPKRGVKRWQMWLGRVWGRVESTNIIGGQGERPPKWPTILTRDDCKQIQDDCGDLMLRLGYTDQDDWYKSVELDAEPIEQSVETPQERASASA